MQDQSRVSFSILFYIKRTKLQKNGEAPIYLRITMDRRRAETSTQFTIKPDSWDSRKNAAKGNSKQSQNLNESLQIIKNSLYSLRRDMTERREFISARSLMLEFQGKSKRNTSILELFKQHNEKLYKSVIKGHSRNTFKKYKTAFNHLRTFIQAEYKEHDLPLKSIDRQFVREFDWHLENTAGLQANSINTNIAAVKKIIRIALTDEIISRDPFIAYSYRRVESKRRYLKEEQLDKIMKVKLELERLDRVRDIFVFSCFTGLSHCDVMNLTQDNIIQHISGQTIIEGKRQKTQIPFIIPVLKPAEVIIQKYHGLPLDGKILPVISNQKTNDYLKEICLIAGIDENVTFHMARHTFATTVTLMNDVPMETVKTMMAHRNIRTTEVYGKILGKKVMKDMSRLNKYLISAI